LKKKRTVGTRLAKRRRFTVRRANLKDLELFVQHRRGMWSDMRVGNSSELDVADRAYRVWARQRLKNGSLLGWIVEDGRGQVAGSGCLWLRSVQPFPGSTGPVEPYLLSMYTDPGFRHQGVASLVVNSAVDWCKRRRYPVMRLHASRMGRSVYKRLGFERSWEMRLRLKKGPTRRKKRA
jgi:GNAT superfamily N-acetyltransferase